MITIFYGCAKTTKQNIADTVQKKERIKVDKPEFVRGVHLSAWVAGEKTLTDRFTPLLGRNKLNTIVIAVKEYDGTVYLSCPDIAAKYNIATTPVKGIIEYLNNLKKLNIYPIARIVVFKDTQLAKRNPGLAVKTPDGSAWRDRKGNMWCDPYNRKVWDYNIAIAKQAEELGFEEIQFDYLRFPSDGNVKLCRYSQKHSSETASAVLGEFLAMAREVLDIPVSIDVFGLTPSVEHDMGIGQKFRDITANADFVSPMMYPSHYYKNEYGIKEPNKEPYKVVFKTVADAKYLLKDTSYQIRPYLQDFSIGYKYGHNEVKAQIKACYDNGIFDWLLWDPKCRYTLSAIEEMVKFTPKNYVVSGSTNNRNSRKE
ncbi:MAG: hypothetical protein BWY26_01017 [Elusimicrobia bacterium ADurb.Bin231]|nr:MAG: hypothetical protein BWY26_01017 [Elusimicrobia bacterium ADurb.Bin231]